LSTGKELATVSHTVQLPAFPLANDPYMRPGLSMEQIRTILWAYRKLSLMIVLVMAALTFAVVMLWPRTYESTATLLVNYEVNDPLNSKEFPIGLLSSYLATQTELMSNSETLLKVVDQLNLTEDKEYRAGYFGSGGSLREYVQKKLSKNLTIYQGQSGSHLIYVTAAARTPEKAALIANTVAEIYKGQEFTRSTGPAVERAKRYSEQLKQLSAKVNQSQEAFTAFHQRNGLIESGDGKATTEVSLLSDLEKQLIDAERATRLAESRSSGDLISADQVMSSQLVQQIKQQLSQQESKLAELQITLGPRHPQVIELNSQIAATRASLTREIDSYSRNATNGLNSAQQLEQKLRRAVAEQRQKVLATSQLHDQAEKLRLDLESAQAVYKRALDGYDQVMFASLGHYTNVDVVGHAIPPVKSSKPKIPIFLALGLFAAVGLGLFLPLAYELTHRRMRCRDDFERDNGVPVLVEFDSVDLPRGYARGYA
jgi:polysaccharide biosynthesis transport protein